MTFKYGWPNIIYIIIHLPIVFIFLISMLLPYFLARILFGIF